MFSETPVILLKLNGFVSGEPQAPMEVTGAPRLNHVALLGLELAPVTHTCSSPNVSPLKAGSSGGVSVGVLSTT